MARTSVKTRDEMLSVLAARCVSGYLRLRSGLIPEAVEVPSSGAMLVEFALGDPAFLPPDGGVLTATPIAGARAVTGGLATWFQVVSADRTTVVYDGTVGPEDGGVGSADLLLDVPAVRAGTMIFVTSMRYRAPAGVPLPLSSAFNTVATTSPE